MAYTSAVDLTTNWTQHKGVLKDANTSALDVTTLFSVDYPDIVAATDERADRNTQFFEYTLENDP